MELTVFFINDIAT